VSQPPHLIVKHWAYWQSTCEQPVLAETTFARTHSTDLKPYAPPRLLVTEEWQQLLAGWVKETGYLMLQNTEGSDLQVQPTEEEREEIRGRIVEIGVLRPEANKDLTMHDDEELPVVAFLVRPGEGFGCDPAELSCLWVRCRRGEARCTLALFPR
jgi:hypothetical protein